MYNKIAQVESRTSAYQDVEGPVRKTRSRERKMAGWRGPGSGNFREEDRYKSFNGFERAVSRAAASFALPLRAACELSKNKINYGTGVFLCGARSSARRGGDYRPKLAN